MKVSKALMILTLKEKEQFVKWMEYKEHMDTENKNNLNTED